MTVSAAETDALICAFRLSPNGALGLEALDLAPSVEQPLWFHFNVLDNRARRYLEKIPDLEEEGRDLLLGSEARIQARMLDDGFAVNLGDLHHDFTLDPEAFGTIRVYVTKRVIVTCRRQRVRSVDRVRREVDSTRDDRSPLDVFALLLDEIVEGFVTLATDIGERVENLQDRILAGHASEQSADLAQIRHVVARFRRHVLANRTMLQPLLRRITATADEAQREQFHAVLERLEATAQDMDLIMERSRLLQEEIASRLGEATNRNLYLLSVVTTALLPITLITGVFGMNVGGLPFLESKHGFFWTMFIMTATLVATMLFLRKKSVL
ncbi:MAG TPA: CorA family divalent cation transporter [Polyangiaceae bacterium]|nr:CorA family divalent cation transporter [Polyangiaceae bacterium]